MESLKQRQLKSHFKVGLFSQCGSTLVTALVDFPLKTQMPLCPNVCLCLSNRSLLSSFFTSRGSVAMRMSSVSK